MKLNFKNSLKFLFAFVIISSILYTHIRASRQFREGDELTEYLRSISGIHILEIQFFSDSFYSKPLQIKDINSTESRNLFAMALRDLNDYHPNHDTHIEEGAISFRLKDKGEYFIDFWIKPKNKKTVCMHLMKKSGPNSYSNLGGRKSETFYEWLNFIKFSKLKNSNNANSRAKINPNCWDKE